MRTLKVIAIAFTATSLGVKRLFPFGHSVAPLSQQFLNKRALSFPISNQRKGVQRNLNLFGVVILTFIILLLLTVLIKGIQYYQSTVKHKPEESKKEIQPIDEKDAIRIQMETKKSKQLNDLIIDSNETLRFSFTPVSLNPEAEHLEVINKR
ncbi:hypothetical protein BC833DRAFT_568232 [Globomyces pollinis-pini]|nr:hypothetical protein BC833DRAFT_568232 [Globomyces pollinis-pini]